MLRDRLALNEKHIARIENLITHQLFVLRYLATGGHDMTHVEEELRTLRKRLGLVQQYRLTLLSSLSAHSDSPGEP